ncbi:MAG: alanine racemase [Myxococcales bacterium]|nr:alanine racemase [Myxococcales bacterium]
MPTRTLPGRGALDRLIRPTRAEIDLAALEHNFGVAKKLAGPAGVLAVVKANAYGHGAVPVARELERLGAAMLGVALVEEGIELRAAGVKAPILVLGGTYEGGYELMVEHELSPAVFRIDHLSRLERAAARLGQSVSAHLKLDTGMGRIGLLPSELEAFLDAAKRVRRVSLDGLLSHFANADLADEALTREQAARFGAALAALRRRGIEPRWRHLANSAAVLELPEACEGLELNLVRPGIMLYGLSPAGWLASRAELRPVLSWKTAVIHLKTVPAGTPVSYGGTWVAPRESRIATLPVGYADGYSRAFSGRAAVLVRGRRAPIVGRVCMDLCMADVTEIGEVEVGDEVVLLGQQGGLGVSAEELARLAGTIHYEVVCGIAGRVSRVECRASRRVVERPSSGGP